jgi:hypothetical protein
MVEFLLDGHGPIGEYAHYNGLIFISATLFTIAVVVAINWVDNSYGHGKR